MTAFLIVFAGVTFLASGLGKLRAGNSSNSFLVDVGVPREIVRSVDRVVSVIEVAVGALLLSGRAAQWTATVAGVLAAAFLAAHLVARLRGSSAPCRCFGAIDVDLTPALSLARSAALFAIVTALAADLYVGAGYTGLPVGNVPALVGGSMCCLTYLLVFRLLNEAAVLTRRDRDIHRRLVAAAERHGGP